MLVEQNHIGFVAGSPFIDSPSESKHIQFNRCVKPSSQSSLPKTSFIPKINPSSKRRARLSSTQNELCSASMKSFDDENEPENNLEEARSRLEGLFSFGSTPPPTPTSSQEKFTGESLRSLIKQKWNVQYDIQPALRMGRVYLQIMWRYYEQQSFYLGEEEFDMHMEAIAGMVKEWGAVDYVKGFIRGTKKKPVVGITVNIPIPGIGSREYENTCRMFGG